MLFSNGSGMYSVSACYYVLCAVECVTITFNAALHRPAFQSSVFGDGKHNYSARFANDGNRSSQHHCSMSLRETNPWWAVDLGGPTTVSRVDLTNAAQPSAGAFVNHVYMNCALKLMRIKLNFGCNKRDAVCRSVCNTCHAQFYRT